MLDAASFALLSDDTGLPASLALGPAVVTLASAYPVASIINAHLTGQPTLKQAAALLSQAESEQALVWRQGFKPKVRSISAAEYGLINALQRGATLDAGLDQACGIDTAFDFNAWLTQAVQTGLVIGAVLLPTQ